MGTAQPPPLRRRRQRRVSTSVPSSPPPSITTRTPRRDTPSSARSARAGRTGGRELGVPGGRDPRGAQVPGLGGRQRRRLGVRRRRFQRPGGRGGGSREGRVGLGPERRQAYLRAARTNEPSSPRRLNRGDGAQALAVAERARRGTCRAVCPQPSKPLSSSAGSPSGGGLSRPPGP